MQFALICKNLLGLFNKHLQAFSIQLTKNIHHICKESAKNNREQDRVFGKNPCKLPHHSLPVRLLFAIEEYIQWDHPRVWVETATFHCNLPPQKSLASAWPFQRDMIFGWSVRSSTFATYNGFEARFENTCFSYYIYTLKQVYDRLIDFDSELAIHCHQLYSILYYVLTTICIVLHLSNISYALHIIKCKLSWLESASVVLFDSTESIGMPVVPRYL